MPDTASTWHDWLADEQDRSARAAGGAPPSWAALVPDQDLPLSQPVQHQTVAITSLPAPSVPPTELVGPISVLDAGAPRPTGPAEGVLLVHDQAWRMKGVTMGKLLSAIALAPGEVTQITVTGWERGTSASAASSTTEEEAAATDAGRSRSISDVTTATARQVQAGSSSSSSFATQASGGVGGAAGFLSANVSGSASMAIASTASFNVGSRSAAADSTQQVRQATQQHASNARGQRSTLVQEVRQSETEQFSSRVVANYNHMHALNLQHFEVLQVYELSTRVVDARRCLFLPMELLDFTDLEVVVAFAQPLAAAARAMGLPSLAEAILSLEEDEEGRAERLAHQLQAEIDAVVDERMRIMRDRFVLPEEELRRRATAAQKREQAVTGRAITIGHAMALTREEVPRQLMERRLAFNQALWLAMEPTQVAALLGSRRHEGVPLASVVDPTPIAVTGNWVGFRWRFGPDQAAEEQAFLARHLDDDAGQVTDTVVLPTGATFAEAVLGRANSAERIDLTRAWKWDDDTIPILPTAIAALHHQRRAQQAEARPTGLGAPSVAAQAMPQMPAGPAHALATAIGTSMFRDMSGSDVIEGLAASAQDAAAAGDAHAQKVAQQTIGAWLDHLEAMLPQAAEALETLGSMSGGQGGGGEGGDNPGGLDASTLGGLKNLLGGEGGTGLDVEGLLSSAAEFGLLL